MRSSPSMPNRRRAYAVGRPRRQPVLQSVSSQGGDRPGQGAAALTLEVPALPAATATGTAALGRRRAQAGAAAQRRRRPFRPPAGRRRACRWRCRHMRRRKRRRSLPPCRAAAAGQRHRAERARLPARRTIGARFGAISAGCDRAGILALGHFGEQGRGAAHQQPASVAPVPSVLSMPSSSGAVAWNSDSALVQAVVVVAAAVDAVVGDRRRDARGHHQRRAGGHAVGDDEIGACCRPPASRRPSSPSRSRRSRPVPPPDRPILVAALRAGQHGGRGG